MTVQLATVWSALEEPWRDPLLRRALLEIAFVGIAGGALGCWVVLYGLSYSAESFAHGLFPGLVLAALVGIPLVAGAAVGLAVAAVAVALAARTPSIGGDTGVAVVVTTLFGAGVLLALSPASPPGIQSLLFGDLLGPSDADLLLAGGLAALIVAALAVLHRPLLAVGFDRDAARRLGISPLAVDLALLLLVAAAILVGVQGLGNLLVVAVLVGPAAIARMVCRRAPAMLAVAAAIAVAAGAGGLYLSYYADVAAGASVAGVIVALYVVAAAVTRLRARAPRAGYDRTRWVEAAR